MLHITKTEKRNVLRAFRAAGVEVQPQSRQHNAKRRRRSAGVKVRSARGKRGLVIFNCRLETVDLNAPIWRPSAAMEIRLE
jgi:hypothetical protein